MTIIAENLDFGTLPSYKYGTDPYDPSKLGLGPLIVQRTGPSPEQRFVGPLPIAVARPMEETIQIQVGYPWAMRWSDTIDWVFVAEAGASSATRRIIKYDFNRETGAFSFSGGINLTYPTTTNHTIRAFRMTYDLHTVGTIERSSGFDDRVIGTDTSWVTDGVCAGNRIGFGSTNPSEVTEWRHISSVTGESELVLDGVIPRYPPGTPYVIEDLRAITATASATASNGGLFVAKGLSVALFSPTSFVIPAATTVDNVRAVYRISGVVLTNVSGLGIQEPVSKAEHYAWALVGTTSVVMQKYNLRAPLVSLSAGSTSAAYAFQTGSVVLTGTASQVNNGRVARPDHTAAAGQECFFFTTATRVYRTKPLNNIISADATFISGGDIMLEVPPGGASTNGVFGTMQSIEYSALLDAFYITLSGSASGQRDYLTKFYAGSQQLDRQVGVDVRQYYQASSAAVAPALSRTGSSFMPWIERGLGYFVMNGNTAATNSILAVPIGADMDFVNRTNSKAVLPKMSIPSAHKLLKTLAQNTEALGGYGPLSLGTEPFAVYYRTAGIDDDSGAWTLLNQAGSMVGVDAAPEIQFMLAFRVAGLSCIPARIHSFALLYETDEALPSGFRWNLGDSNQSNGTLGMVQTSLLPALGELTITYYRADTNQAVLVQSSGDSEFGAWEFYSEGSASWVAGVGSNAVGVRRRFVPSAGLPVGVDLYAKVTIE